MCAYRIPDLDAQLDVYRPRAVCATEKVTADFDPVPNNPGFAMFADRREPLDRTFKGVEDVHVAAHGLHLKGQPIVIAAYFAHSHNSFCPTGSHHVSGSAAVNIIHGSVPTGGRPSDHRLLWTDNPRDNHSLRKCEPWTRPRGARSASRSALRNRRGHRRSVSQPYRPRGGRPRTIPARRRLIPVEGAAERGTTRAA